MELIFIQVLQEPKFESLCDDLFKSLFESIDKVIRDSQIDKSNVDEIVLVGGSSRIQFRNCFQIILMEKNLVKVLIRMKQSHMVQQFRRYSFWT